MNRVLQSVFEVVNKMKIEPGDDLRRWDWGRTHPRLPSRVKVHPGFPVGAQVVKEARPVVESFYLDPGLLSSSQTRLVWPPFEEPLEAVGQFFADSSAISSRYSSRSPEDIITN